MVVHWLAKEKLFDTALARLVPADVVLDLGCGIRPQPYLRPLVHICCEPFAEYLAHLTEKVRDEEDRTYLLVKASWAEAARMFPERSVDSVFLLDVIEHVEKEEAVALLKATVRIARRQVAVFTPLGFFPQGFDGGPDAWGLGGGEWQEHRSGWRPEDFDEAWEVFATPEFHTTDSRGARLEKPVGAIWAFWTAPQRPGTDGEPSLKQKLRTIHDIAVDNRAGGLNLFIRLMRLGASIKTSKTCLWLYRVLMRRGRP
jgi:hypothetical protein